VLCHKTGSQNSEILSSSSKDGKITFVTRVRNRIKQEPFEQGQLSKQVTNTTTKGSSFDSQY